MKNTFRTDDTIKVVLIEDSRKYREALTLAFKNSPEINFIEEFGTAEIALHQLRQSSDEALPDIILLDLNLPGMSGLEIIPLIQEAVPETRIVILTQSDQEEDILKAMRKGAVGYLLKSATISAIHDAIKTVMSGGVILDPSVAQYIINNLSHSPKTKTEGKALSPRELEILILVSDGLAQKEIAEKLKISITTVLYHIKHIYEKLDVTNAPAAVTKAYRSGILS